MAQVLVLCVLLWNLASLLTTVSTDLSSPVVKTKLGIIRGKYNISYGGRKYAAFEGLPYAMPPIGERRFKEAIMVEQWQGELNGTVTSHECIQVAYGFDSDEIIGDEDCLYLNVYTPSLNSIKPLEVIVYIHGGGFMQGASFIEGPKYLMDRDVVYVNINYRLGVFGFFSTGDTLVPGNNGLKDQVLALKWVQLNIAEFGGDPNRVTIAGSSAGGASVHLHYLSPLSKGLFNRGMSLSGNALDCWTQAEDLPNKGKRLASYLQCPISSSKEQIDCLRQRPARDIVDLMKHFMVWRIIPFSPWGPVVEINHPGAFLSEQPIEILLGGRAQPLPWLTSVTSEEGLYPLAYILSRPTPMAELEKRWTELSALLMDWNNTVSPEKLNYVAQEAKHYYMGDKRITNSITELIQMAGDRLFVVDGERAARIHATYNAGPVYFYQFSHRGEHSYADFMSGTYTNWGAGHADDILYALGATYTDNVQTDNDRAMKDIMVNIWVNYAKTGNPSPGNILWQPLKPNETNLTYLWLGNGTNIEMRTTTDLGHRKFWDSLPIQEPQISGTRQFYLNDEL